MERGKQLRVLEHIDIKFTAVFTRDSFQVLADTGPFLKGCLTKELRRVERMWATENFQVRIVMTEYHRMGGPQAYIILAV